ncbi:hypothetical protein DFH28DRAFT_887021, partial [Melampsora americana]
YLPMPMLEVEAGKNQWFYCGLFGDCPDRYQAKECKEFDDWCLIKNGKYYSVLALWTGEW